MAVDLELAPKQKRPAGEPCCEPVVYPDVEREQAERMAEVAKALGDPIRLQLVDVLRKHAGKVCVCELVPLFDISQPTLSHHLKKLREAGIVDSERRGLWAYYYVLPDALEELSAWLTLTDIEVREARARALRGRRPAAPPTRLPAAAGPPSAVHGPDMTLDRSQRREVFGAALYGDEADARRRPPWRRRSAAASRPRSPTCTRARPCSTSARAPAPTCSSPPAASARPAGRSGST